MNELNSTQVVVVQLLLLLLMSLSFDYIFFVNETQTVYTNEDVTI